MLYRILLLSVSLLTSGCGRNDSEISQFQRTSHLVPEGATRLESKVELIGGYLKIAPLAGADAAAEYLAVLDLATNLPELVPTPLPGVVVLGTLARLDVVHPRYAPSMGRAKNEWRIGFGDRLPTTLEVAMMSGVCEIRLAGLRCEKLDARVDQGQLVIDCAGAPLVTGCLVTAEVGTGQVRVRYPADPTIGVRVRGRKAVGGVVVTGLREVGIDKELAYVNDAFETAAIKLDFALGSGFGEVVVEPADGP